MLKLLRSTRSNQASCKGKLVIVLHLTITKAILEAVQVKVQMERIALGAIPAHSLRHLTRPMFLNIMTTGLLLFG